MLYYVLDMHLNHILLFDLVFPSLLSSFPHSMLSIFMRNFSCACFYFSISLFFFLLHKVLLSYWVMTFYPNHYLVTGLVLRFVVRHLSCFNWLEQLTETEMEFSRLSCSHTNFKEFIFPKKFIVNHDQSKNIDCA